MRIVVPGIDASQSGLGKSIPLIHGMPADGLSALYLFDAGVDGQQVSQFPDLSGNGRHAALYGDYAAPIKRAWGLEVQSVNGLMLATGVPIGQECTVLLALEALVPSAESGVFQTFFGAGANNYNVNPASYIGNSQTPVINFSRSGSPGNYALFDGTSGSSVLGSNRLNVTGGPVNNQATVLAMRLNGPGNTMSLRATLGTERVVARPEIGAHYAEDRGEIMIGAWGHASLRASSSPNARLFGAAIYDRALADDMLALAMQGVRRRAEAAGIVFAA